MAYIDQHARILVRTPDTDCNTTHASTLSSCKHTISKTECLLSVTLETPHKAFISCLISAKGSVLHSKHTLLVAALTTQAPRSVIHTAAMQAEKNPPQQKLYSLQQVLAMRKYRQAILKKKPENGITGESSRHSE